MDFLGIVYYLKVHIEKKCLRIAKKTVKKKTNSGVRFALPDKEFYKATKIKSV